jgi:hypothetical protein
MIKKHQNNNSDYGNKTFPKIKTYFTHIPLKLHILEWYNGLSSLSLFQKIYLKKSLMFYLNSNGDKNNVISLVIPKIVTR